MDDELFSTEDCVVLPRSPMLKLRLMDVNSKEDSMFVTDEVSKLIQETVERIIGSNPYQHNKVNHWTAEIVDQMLTELTNLDKPFKYIVQAIIMQNNGEGLHVASSCFWDNIHDGSCTVRWENKYLSAIVFVFGLSI